MLEEWKIGRLEDAGFSFFHHSTIPSFQYSSFLVNSLTAIISKSQASPVITANQRQPPLANKSRSGLWFPALPLPGLL